MGARGGLEKVAHNTILGGANEREMVTEEQPPFIDWGRLTHASVNSLR